MLFWISILVSLSDSLKSFFFSMKNIVPMALQVSVSSFDGVAVDLFRISLSRTLLKSLQFWKLSNSPPAAAPFVPLLNACCNSSDAFALKCRQCYGIALSDLHLLAVNSNDAEVCLKLVRVAYL